MYGRGKSDCLIVPAKPSNNAAVRLRRWWREGGSARGTRPAQRVPDTEPEPARRACWTVCVGLGLTEPTLDPSEEPSAVVPPAGICAGGRPKGRFLPRPRRGPTLDARASIISNDNLTS